MVTQEDIDRLKEIRTTMFDLLDEAKNLVRQHASKQEHERAKAYWFGQIDAALGDGEYFSDTHNMQKTINSIEDTLPPEDDEESEEDIEE